MSTGGSVPQYENYLATTVLLGQQEASLTRWAIAYFKARIAPHLPADRSARILEIGCGYGRNLLALKELGYGNAEGVDISAEAVCYASDVLGLSNVRQASATDQLGAGDEGGDFDAILLIDVLEHLEVQESLHVIAAARRLLRPGGCVVIQVPNAVAPMAPNLHADITHYRAYTTYSMEQTLRMAEFSEMRFFELPPHVHGMASLARRILWAVCFKPLLKAFMLAAYGGSWGGIYTLNLLAVARTSGKTQP
jgi:SAM-dependent methyltransferase